MDGRRMKSNGLHATHDAPTAIVLMKYVIRPICPPPPPPTTHHTPRAHVKTHRRRANANPGQGAVRTSWYCGSQLTSTSAGPTCTALRDAWMLAMRLPCDTMTPFGSDVEPEVYWMNAKSCTLGWPMLPLLSVVLGFSRFVLRHGTSGHRRITPLATSATFNTCNGYPFQAVRSVWGG